MPGGEVKQEDNMLFKGNMMRSFSKALLIAIFLLFGMAITACAAPKAELAAGLDERSAIDVYDYNWQLNN